MRKMPRNPFQDKINALNLKDLDETLKTQSYLKQSHEPIQDDINNARYTMTDILPVNVLKPEDLSMKDLLDQIQIQTILNNNTPPFIEKKIKSETTEAMIKDFQNEMAKPVEINGTFYKFRPPGVAINLKNLPPEFPDEATYQANVRALARQEFAKQDELGRRIVQIQDIFRGLNQNLDNGSLSIDEFHKAQQYYAPIDQQLRDAIKESQMKVSTLEQDWKDYSKNKLEYDAQREKISKENKQALTDYEDEIKSRNTGMEVGQREGESDADYAQRMIDIAHETVDPASVELQAKSFAYNAVKDRLNEVLPAYKSEAVLNAIIDEGGYEKLQPIKDQWPMLKKKLEETFGDVRRVENTDSIAQVLYVSSLKPAVRQGPVNAVPIPTVPTPNVTRASTALVPTKAIPSVSTLPLRYNPATANLIDTSFPSDPRFESTRASVVPSALGAPVMKTSARDRLARMKREQALQEPQLTIDEWIVNDPEFRDEINDELKRNPSFLNQLKKYAKREPARKEDLYNRALLRKEQLLSNLSAKKERERLKASQKRAEAITSIDLALEPTDRFYPTELALRSYPTINERINQLLAPPTFTPKSFTAKTAKRTPIKNITRISEPLRTGVEDLGPRPQPLTQRSKSLEQRIQEAGGKEGIPISVILPSQLVDILQANGLPALTGNNIDSKRKNYDAVVQAGLLPKKPNVLKRDEITSMSDQALAEYLYSEGMVGSRGGISIKGEGQARPREELMKIYNRYAQMYGYGMTGSGVDIKARFDIIDGEINAGNNNPALIRDAKKLLKEMVTKKMVSLYEAQTHLKHLRSLNKI